MITGESRPIAKGVGAPVIAGSINLDGPLLIRSSGAGNATRWAQICRSVRDALLRRSPSQRIADAWSAFSCRSFWRSAWRPRVLGAARAVRSRAAGRLAVLVVACPCARSGLAAPLATSLGIGRLARYGCLVRDPGALEALARTRLMAFDKTGTLTFGQGTRRRHRKRRGRNRRGTGPSRRTGAPFRARLARAIALAAAVRGVEPLTTRDVRTVPGRGIRGNADGQAVAAGNWRLDERPRMAVGPRPSRAGASAGGERSLRRLCRLGGGPFTPCCLSTIRRFRRRATMRCASRSRALRDAADRRSRGCCAADCRRRRDRNRKRRGGPDAGSQTGGTGSAPAGSRCGGDGRRWPE